jgi:hypothetical protein
MQWLLIMYFLFIKLCLYPVVMITLVGMMDSFMNRKYRIRNHSLLRYKEEAVDDIPDTVVAFIHSL